MSKVIGHLGTCTAFIVVVCYVLSFPVFYGLFAFSDYENWDLRGEYNSANWTFFADFGVPTAANFGLLCLTRSVCHNAVDGKSKRRPRRLP